MSGLTIKQQEKLRHMLDQNEAKLQDEIANRAMHAPEERGARATADGTMDMADEASAGSLADVHIALVNHLEQALHDIAAARVRMESGFYGSCTDCGDDIGFDRLSAYPTAKRCIYCQQQREKTFASIAA